jgi:hypothetical protein
MKRITISYTEKEEDWINEYPAMKVDALFRRMINFLIESKSLGLDQNDAIEISRSTVKREMGASV